MKIALALSGGGYRATVFHLGMLARLAHQKRLEEVTFLSTVSGGSLAAALVHAANDLKWPDSTTYLARVLPRARELLTTQDFQTSIIWRVLRWPWRIFDTRASELSALMQSGWGLTAKLSDLPHTPRWMINATCYESGKDWRFERFRMGDYVFGYSYDTDLPVADAVASSCGFPGLIGPLVLDATQRKWFRYVDRKVVADSLNDPGDERQRLTEPAQPAYPAVHLWDGGVYDNHGLEGIHDFTTGWRKDVEFLLVSDGAGHAGPEAYRSGIPALLRIATGIMMDQVRSLRARAILERLVNHKDLGSFVRAGNSCAYVLRQAGRADEIPEKAPGCLSEDDAKWAGNFPTVIRKLTIAEFEKLFRHGFEVADYTLYAYMPDMFPYVGYHNRGAQNLGG